MKALHMMPWDYRTKYRSYRQSHRSLRERVNGKVPRLTTKSERRNRNELRPQVVTSEAR